MSNNEQQPVVQAAPKNAKELFESNKIREKFNEIMGKRSGQFITSILQIVSSSKLLERADAFSIYNAACLAATLNLPINPNLGFAYIIPYKTKIKTPHGWNEIVLAQFQIGYKGFIQLALRTNQYQNINVISVFENQFKSYNSLTETLDADFSIRGTGKIVGYAAYFKLKSGFEKLSFWYADEVMTHAKRFSKTFNDGPWQSDYDGMAKKTVLKNTISKWGIMSTELEQAITADQGIINDENATNIAYIDNPETTPEDKALERAMMMLSECKTVDEVVKLQEAYPDLPMDEVNAKVDSIVTSK